MLGLGIWDCFLLAFRVQVLGIRCLGLRVRFKVSMPSRHHRKATPKTNEALAHKPDELFP